MANKMTLKATKTAVVSWQLKERLKTTMSTDSDIAEHAKETIPTAPVRGRTITCSTARNRGGCRGQRGGRTNRSDPPAEDNAKLYNIT